MSFVFAGDDALRTFGFLGTFDPDAVNTSLSLREPNEANSLTQLVEYFFSDCIERMNIARRFSSSSSANYTASMLFGSATIGDAGLYSSF